MRNRVRDGYATIAETGSLATVTGGCCGGDRHGPLSNDDLAAKLGYTTEELAVLPEGANMGLSCGNPTAIAALQPGQVVLDLGSGGGFDCFLAGPKVGENGRVIGVDMTPAMLTKARQNLDHYRQSAGLDNVEFRLGEIEHLPVADASADVVISNCVINLSPDKAQVWREIARVLRPGGRAVVSDIVLLRPLPGELREMVEALVGCVAGAVMIDDYRAAIDAAGLTEVQMTAKPQYVEALQQAGDPLYQRITEKLPAGDKPSDYVASMDIVARRD
jgi:SAM-dependent methyltransferase